MHQYSAVIRVCLSQKFCIGGPQGHNDLGLYLFGDIRVVTSHHHTEFSGNHWIFFSTIQSVHRLQSPLHFSPHYLSSIPTSICEFRDLSIRFVAYCTPGTPTLHLGALSAIYP